MGQTEKTVVATVYDHQGHSGHLPLRTCYRDQEVRKSHFGWASQYNNHDVWDAELQRARQRVRETLDVDNKKRLWPMVDLTHHQHSYFSTNILLQQTMQRRRAAYLQKSAIMNENSMHDKKLAILPKT